MNLFLNNKVCVSSILASDSEVGVLIHKVVEVGDFPFKRWLVIHGENPQQIVPLHVGLESDNVGDELGIITSEKDLAVVLVLHVHLHRRLDQSGDSHAVRGGINVDAIDELSSVVLGSVVGDWGAQHGALTNVVVLL